MANTVTLGGNPVPVNGNLPQPGQPAPAFSLVGKTLADVTLADFAGKRKVLNIFPSIDTPTCATSVRKFNQTANQLANTVEDANEQLRLLDLRLDAVVAKAAQLVMRPDSMGELAAVEGQLDSAVGELNALGAGLAAVDALSGMP